MQKRHIIISFFLTFLILLIGIISYKLLVKQAITTTNFNPPNTAALRKVTIKKIIPTTVTSVIPIDGRLSALEEVRFSSNVSGNLQPTQTLIKKGMFFKKDILLFEIDQGKVVNNLYAMRGRLLNAIIGFMPDLKMDYPDLHRKWKKYLDDFELEKTVKPLPEITHEKEKYLIAARNIYELYYKIKSAEIQLTEYAIYAPFSGVITEVHAFPGTMVMPGQPLATMINTQQFELEATVSETDLTHIKIGNEVELTTASAIRKWIGKVGRIGAQIDRITQSIPIYIQISGTDLKDGLYLNGQINGTELKDILPIPKQYVFNQNYIHTVKDSSITLTRIHIKHQDANFIYAAAFPTPTWMVYESPRGIYKGQKIIPMQIEE